MTEIETKIQVLLEEIVNQRALINKMRKDLININARIALLNIEIDILKGDSDAKASNN